MKQMHQDMTSCFEFYVHLLEFVWIETLSVARYNKKFSRQVLCDPSIIKIKLIVIIYSNAPMWALCDVLA